MMMSTTSVRSLLMITLIPVVTVQEVVRRDLMLLGDLEEVGDQGDPGRTAQAMEGIMHLVVTVALEGLAVTHEDPAVTQILDWTFR